MRARVLVPFLLLSNAAVVGGLVKMMRADPAAAPAPPREREDAPDLRFPLQFIIRVPNGDTDHFVRTAYELVLEAPGDHEVMSQNLPRIRDAVLRYFLSHKVDDFTGSAGIERSKRIVREQVKRIAKRPVRAIFLTDLVVM